MSYGENHTDSWTSCSRADFEEWYKATGFVCLDPEEVSVSCGDHRLVGSCGECASGLPRRYALLLCRGDCAWDTATSACTGLQSQAKTPEPKKGNSFSS